MKSFKHFELESLKVRKFLKHSSKIRYKIYKGKIYLSGNAFTNKDYVLYDIGDLSIEEVFSTIKWQRAVDIFSRIQEREKSY